MSRQRQFLARWGHGGNALASPPELQLPGHLRRFAFETHGRFTLPSVRPFGSVSQRGLLWPLLTSRSAAKPRRPFKHEARSPQVRTLSFTARPPDLRRLSLGHRSFAVSCPLAPLDAASDPVLVHRPTVSLRASFPRLVTLPQLRFTSLRMTSLWRDLHPQDSAHAGRTKRPRVPRTRGHVELLP